MFDAFMLGKGIGWVYRVICRLYMKMYSFGVIRIW